jgi:GntR family transcriptional regulator/MocR family aminotransferase
MRAVYAERRRALVSALEGELGDGVRVMGEQAGMHLVVMLPPGTDDHDVAVRAARRGISAAPLSSCYVGRRRKAGLVLGFGSTRPRDMPEAVRVLRWQCADDLECERRHAQRLCRPQHRYPRC